LVLATGVLAQGTASVDWWVVAGGGGESSEAGKVVMNSTLGQPIIGPSSDKAVALGAGYWYGADGPPTAVTLASFTATPVDGHILIEWETAMEIDTVGFNLYRSESPGGPYVKLNDTLIPSQALGAPFGADYAWPDENVQSGITYYYYKLEDVEVGGQYTFHGPIAARAGGPTAVILRALGTNSAPGGTLLAIGLVVCLSGATLMWRVRRRT
jgi:hypothetical protein